MSATNVTSKCRIARIEPDDAMILAQVANPDGSYFRKGQAGDKLLQPSPLFFGKFGRCIRRRSSCLMACNFTQPLDRVRNSTQAPGLCDCSPPLVASRPAKVGNQLITTKLSKSVTCGSTAVSATCQLPCIQIYNGTPFRELTRERHADGRSEADDRATEADLIKGDLSRLPNQLAAKESCVMAQQESRILIPNARKKPGRPI